MKYRDLTVAVFGLAVLLMASSAGAADPVGKPYVYKTVDSRELKLYVNLPPDWQAEQRRPAILFFHGGAWVGGQPGQFTEHSRYFASRGMVTVQVEYRLLDRKGTDPPIVCIRDAKSAVRWVRSRASQFGIDPNRIATAGGSAGGHLASFLALCQGVDDPADDLTISAASQAMLLFNPVFDNGPGGWGTKRVGDDYPVYSPFHNVDDKAPPAIVFFGTKDKLVPVSTAVEFQDRMRKVGVVCELLLFEDAPHGFFNHGKSGNWPYYETVMAADRFLAKLGWIRGEPTLKEPTAERTVKIRTSS